MMIEHTFMSIVNDRISAHALLDAAQLGVPVSSGEITRALMFTGDVAMPHRTTQPDARASSLQED